MNKYLISIAAFSFAATVPLAHADTKTLAESKECFSCHAEKMEKGKAPSLKEIAKKYKGVANAEAGLAQKIQAGGVGHWGPNPMPAAGGARATVSEAEAKELAAWVLKQ